MSFKQFVNFVPTQDYAAQKRELLNARTLKLFKDPAFPTDDNANQQLDLPKERSKKVVWKRPREIVKKPTFISNGALRFDVRQGELGDCWLLAAIANLTLHKEYLEQVVPSDQTFEKNDYAGIFHFRFWHFGKWVDVVVDDRLPTIKGQLVFMRSAENNEFWSALLEKAYAKLHGSYGALTGGHTSEAMEDFTGGLSELYFTTSEYYSTNLFSILLTAHQRGSFIACSVHDKFDAQEAILLSKGIVDCHAYSITSVKHVVKLGHLEGQNFEKTFQLIRIRNPWGTELEWNGPWSDKSVEWSSVTLADRKRLGLSTAPDGEFWMSFDDFRKYFDSIEITNLSPDQLEDKISTRLWVEKRFEGRWVPGVSAGGSRLLGDSFYKNPKYMVTLNDPDEHDDDELCTFVVSVMQKYNRKKDDLLRVGFVIYKANHSLEIRQSAPDSQQLDANFFRRNHDFVAESKPIYRRGICKRFRLKPGNYCIVPSTYEPHKEREFLLRYFTEKVIKNTRKNTAISLTSKMENLSLCSNIDLADNKVMKKNSVIDDAFSCEEFHLWDNFIWAKVDKDDDEYKFVRGEFKATLAKNNKCPNCNLWFSSTYFNHSNHFKHCVFDTNIAAEIVEAEKRWSKFGGSVTEDMRVSFIKLLIPIKGCSYRCLSPKCRNLTEDLQTMKEHIWMEHTKEKPYRCTECANAGIIYKCSESAALESHFKSDHMLNSA